MLGWIDILKANDVAYGIACLLVTTGIRGVLFFAIVYFFVSNAKGLSPSQRHLFWLFGAGSVLLIPAVSLVAFPLRVIDPAFLTEKRSGLQTFFAAVIQWVIRLNFPPAPRLESGSFICFNKQIRLHRPSWEFWAASGWGAGVLYSWGAIAAGVFRLVRVTKAAVPPRSPDSTALLNRLAGEAGIRREVHLLESARCRVPFACYMRKPVILVPPGADRWPRGRLRAVLAHELAHVKRMDFITQLASRVVCSLLWFVPFVWASHANLHVEQEKACDELTVRGGTKPADYAGHLVALARAVTRRDPLYAGIFISKIHRSSLESRVADILGNARKPEPTVPGVPRPVPARFLRPFSLCVLCTLPLLFINPAVGEARRNYIDPGVAARMAAGTWVNMDYNYPEDPNEQKVVIFPNGKIESWTRVDNLGPNGWYDYEIVRAWIGKDGCLYCNAHRRGSYRVDSASDLWRIDRSGAVWENMYRGDIRDEFPERIDPDPDPRSPDNYAIYYRG